MSYDDLAHYMRVVAALAETIRLMQADRFRPSKATDGGGKPDDDT